jgi:3-hydroxyisobutyrate dehydrogenase-like beta-hydroxyacid dehydrogenase
MNKELALIGFGEAGSTFARAAVWGHQASGWDVSLTRRKAMKNAGIVEGASPTDTVRHASLILSVVTADQSLCAAEACAHSLTTGAIWCDMNSVAPETKLAAAGVIEAAGGRYVDVAIMAPVNPLRLAVPLFLAGPSALQADPMLGRQVLSR